MLRAIAPAPIGVQHAAGTLLLAIALFALGGQVGMVRAQSSEPAQPDARGAIVFAQADHALAAGDRPPAQGWSRGPVATFWEPQPGARLGGDRIGWTRVEFGPLPARLGPYAALLEDNREHVTVFLNGREIFRNHAGPHDPVIGWNHPYLVPLPAELLSTAHNTLILRVATDETSNLSSGSIRIAPHAALLGAFNWDEFWRIVMPLAANYTMLGLAFAAFAMWLAQRERRDLLWLSLSGVLWFCRNFIFFGERAPLRIDLFLQSNYFLLFFASAASLAFVTEFLAIRHPLLRAKWLFAGAAALCAVHVLGQLAGGYDLFAYVGLMIGMLGTSLHIFREGRRTGSTPHVAMATLVTATTLIALHDFGRIPTVNLWDGLGFHVQPFIGVVLFFASLISFGARFVFNAMQLSRMNQTLEKGIAEATRALACSEQSRRELEVARAVEQERERMMREMHDGIGSNLVTALAIAENHNESPRAIETLRRALADLKVTTDSLAPVDGEVVTLIASLRHRMEPDLADAGLRCVWQVEECPPLPWLDPQNALHMMRIIQEAVGNAVAHSGASTLQFGCRPAIHDGRDGITIFVSDNGIGLTLDRIGAAGSGIANMRERAQLLGGMLELGPGIDGRGTRLMLWLPLQRTLPSYA